MEISAVLAIICLTVLMLAKEYSFFKAVERTRIIDKAKNLHEAVEATKEYVFSEPKEEEQPGLIDLEQITSEDLRQ